MSAVSILLLTLILVIGEASAFGRDDSWDFGYANRISSGKNRFKAKLDPNKLRTPKFILDQLGQRTSGGGEGSEDNFYEEEPPLGPKEFDYRPQAQTLGPWQHQRAFQAQRPWGPWAHAKLPPFFYPVLIPVPIPVPSDPQDSYHYAGPMGQIRKRAF